MLQALLSYNSLHIACTHVLRHLHRPFDPQIIALWEKREKYVRITSKIEIHLAHYLVDFVG